MGRGNTRWQPGFHVRIVRSIRVRHLVLSGTVSTVEVRVGGGRVRGRRGGGGGGAPPGGRWAPAGAAPLGAPYAAPPFGPHRFASPRPVGAWSGVRDGTRFGPVAP